MMTRRDWIASSAGALLASHTASAAAPAVPVAVARCQTYGPELVTTLSTMFDQLGGLGRLVAGKTVAIKINLTGSPKDRLGYLPAELAHWTHPSVIGATIHLMHRAGARRVRLLESCWSTAEPVEETMYEAGWQVTDLLNAGGIVELENTNWLGLGKTYRKFTPPNGGHLFGEYWLNHSYEDCDVFVSIAKLKEHMTTGITAGMKNLFGITPCTIYGDGAGSDEPSVKPRGGRGAVFHAGSRPPSKSVAGERNPSSPREGGYRVPRAVADLVAARPVHLTIVDGIATMSAGEGPWSTPQAVAITPGVLIAGTNCVNTDAVCASVMGFDPMADRGKAPFETSDNMLRLAEEHGVGTRDLRRIEIAGLPVEQVRFDIRKYRRALPTDAPRRIQTSTNG